jgi:uncharacterized protein involved in exopolysaccharide biosynthesis
MTEQIKSARSSADDEINLTELFSAIWQGKWVIVTITFVFMVVSVFYTLSLPNIYKSEALLAPVSEQGGLKIPGQLGGLAALAGVNLGGMGGGDKTGLAMEIIRSREFLSRFIEKHDLFIPVMAAEGWNRADNSLIIDADIYNQTTNEWVREVKAPYQAKPSLLEVHEEFLKLFTISQDKTSGMVTISVEYYSPFLAKQWVDELVKALNEEMRNRELTEAQRSISYLHSQIEQTSIADMRTMLFSLIEEQTKTVMLANVRDEYVFKTVDPAVVTEKKAKPARALIVILATLLCVMLSSLLVLLRYFNRKL